MEDTTGKGLEGKWKIVLETEERLYVTENLIKLSPEVVMKVECANIKYVIDIRIFLKIIEIAICLLSTDKHK